MRGGGAAAAAPRRALAGLLLRAALLARPSLSLPARPVCAPQTSLCVRRAVYWDPEMGKEDPAKKVGVGWGSGGSSALGWVACCAVRQRGLDVGVTLLLWLRDNGGSLIFPPTPQHPPTYPPTDPLHPTTHPPSTHHAQGICSNFLCDAKPGQEITMTGPTGKVLLLPEDPNAVIICVATGEGRTGGACGAAVQARGCWPAAAGRPFSQPRPSAAAPPPPRPRPSNHPPTHPLP